MEALFGILASLFAGVNIFQFIFFRSQRKKAGAEASQEGAKADGMNLDNIIKYSEIRDKLLIDTEERASALIAKNAELESIVRKYDYEITDLKRVVSGLQRMWNEDIARRVYAENNICLNSSCKDRRPTLGTFNHKTENNESMRRADNI